MVAVSAEPQSDTAAATEPEQAQGLAEVVVTGSLLPTTPDQVAVPIITLDAKTMEQNGVTTNALEILRKSVPAFAGRSNAGTSNANNDNQRTGGGSQLQLRNLPTLVLINGRRVAIHAIAGTNGKNFVDVNRSEEHTSELQSHSDLVCRLLLEKKNPMLPVISARLMMACATLVLA